MDKNVKNTLYFLGGYALGSLIAGYCLYNTGKVEGFENAGAKCKPTQVYSKDVDGDGLQDIIIATKLKNMIFLQGEDGMHRPLEDVKAEEQEEIQKSVDDVLK